LGLALSPKYTNKLYAEIVDYRSLSFKEFSEKYPVSTYESVGNTDQMAKVIGDDKLKRTIFITNIFAYPLIVFADIGETIVKRKEANNGNRKENQ
jgi:hypothetical protein